MHELLVAATQHALRARVQWEDMEIAGKVDSSGLVTISTSLTLVERYSTLMHEFAHLALDRFATGDPFADRETEDRCDEWAAIRLVPEIVLELAIWLAGDRREVGEIVGVDPGILDARLRLAGMEGWGLTDVARAVG